MVTPGSGEQASLTVTHDGDALVATLAGEIDISNADQLADQLAPDLGPERRVVFDLSGVGFMDTSGLALLLDTAAAVADCVVRNPSSQVRRVIEATGLTSVLRVES